MRDAIANNATGRASRNLQHASRNMRVRNGMRVVWPVAMLPLIAHADEAAVRRAFHPGIHREGCSARPPEAREPARN